ncbi:MAG TPA: T9SS type A sorting domain-containing protein, partial [Panacibacter sp.]|nr:T9SS type A sorting domain-containing protein [Panacibacter sp.]
GGVTFNIATADNTATTANADYVAKSLTSQTIPAGSLSYNFTVTVNGDITVEPNETFFVNVSSVTGATVSDAQGLGTISNDDNNNCTPPVVTDPRVTQPSCLVPAGQITVKATSASTMQYSIDNGVSFKNTATFKSLAVGSYNIVVRLLATPDCKTTYASNPVIINPVPDLVAPTAIVGPAGVCRNSTNQVFSVAPVAGAASYQWTLPPGATGSSTKDSIVLSFNAAYVSGDICVKAINACGQSASFCRQIKYYDAKPITPGAINGKTVGLCSNQIYTIASVPNATVYNWVVPANTNIKSGQGTEQIELSFLSGFASGTLSVTASNCNGASAAQSVQLSRNPDMPSSIAGPISAVCAGSTQNYSCALVTGATVYTWKVPSTAVIASGQGTNAISVNFGASFVQGSISVTAGTSCATKSAAKSISIASKPAVPAAITGPAAVCPQAIGLKYNTTAVPGVTYNWVVPNGASITAGQGTAAITMNMGTLAGNVRVSGSNACGSSSFQSLAVSLLTCKMTSSTNLKTGQVLPGVRISPNPAKSVIYIQLTGYTGSVAIQLRSLEGKMLVQQKLQMSPSITAQQTMDVSMVAGGVYLLTIIDQKGTARSEKVIIER